MASRRDFLKLAGGSMVVAATPSLVRAKAKYVAKVGHLEAATQPRNQGLIKVAALVKERTKDDVEFQLFPAGQLGNARQMIEGTQFGSLECTVEPAAFLGGFDPIVSVFDIPFLLPEDRAKADALCGGKFGEYILNSFSSRGFVAVALWQNGQKCMTSNRPLPDLAAFKGQKFRVMDSKILIEQFAAVGASAIALPFGQLYTALQTGVVDGEENPLDTITTMKFYEVQKNLVVSNHGAMEDVILFNPTWWKSLPKAYQKIITEAFIEVRPEVEKMKAAAAKAALDKIKAYGKVNVRLLTDAERKKWRAVMEPKTEAAYVQIAGAEGKKALAIYHAELKRLGIQM